MARNRSRLARPGRFETRKRPFVLKHQVDLPADQRHKYEATIYSTGRVLIRSAVRLAPGAGIRSQLGVMMQLAMFNGPFLPEGEIRLRRFGGVSQSIQINDDWRAWDEELQLRKAAESKTRPRLPAPQF